MGIFSFFVKKQFDPRLLAHLEKIGISETELKDFLLGWNIRNPYTYANSSGGLNDLLFIGGTKEEYFSFFQKRFELIEKYTPRKIEKAISYKFNILNPLIFLRNIDNACAFFVKEGFLDPFGMIDRYGYNIFYRGGKIDKVIDKYGVIKNHPYLQGKLKSPLIFTLESAGYSSVETIKCELEIYHECDLIDFFLSEVNSFGIIQKGEEKLEVFAEVGFSKKKRNEYLRKNFISVMNYKMSPNDLRESLVKSH